MYILRARVIEGSIPMPHPGSDPVYAGLRENNFEIIAPYTRENFKRLYDIGKKAWDAGTLSKYEILAWAGGVNNPDGDRFLWRYRPDHSNFDRLPPGICANFDNVEPQALDENMRYYYDHLWKPLEYGFSLAAYEAGIRKSAYFHSAEVKPSLSEIITSAQNCTERNPAVHRNVRSTDEKAF